MKKIFTIITLLFFCVFTIAGCCYNQKKQRVVCMNHKENLEKDVYFTVINDIVNERFEVIYEGKDNFESFFSFEIYTGQEKIWSLWDETLSDNVPISIFGKDGREPEHNQAHGCINIDGETTLYISYAGLADELKDECKNYTGNKSEQGLGAGFVIYVNGYQLMKEE